MDDQRSSNPWKGFRADHTDRRRKGGPLTIALICIFFGLGGGAAGWLITMNSAARYSYGPRESESTEQYNERFFNYGKIGGVAGAAIGVGFVLMMLIEQRKRK